MKKLFIVIFLGGLLLGATVDAADLMAKLKGKILLQVEGHGEAWYVSPKDGKRHFLGRPEDAFQVLREQGVGISNKDLATIAMDDGSKATLARIAKEKNQEKEVFAGIKSFIENELMMPNASANIEAKGEEFGLYHYIVNIGNEKVDSYASKDGKYFFPSRIDIENFKKMKNTAASETNATPTEVSNKTARPQVELFVMSYCPYGTQMEKGLLPVLKALGDTIDFQVKFNDYAMHGFSEIEEEMNQYCIQKNYQAKYQDYLGCYLANQDRSACLVQAGIPASELDACVTAVDGQYGISSSYNDKTTWENGSYPNFPIYKADNAKYGVSGSPTLVINGEKLYTPRDSASLLSAICGAFTDKPSACSTELSSESPSPGFGYGQTTGATGNASCGS